jgi:ParB family chromosome partitioning protein
MSETKRLGRGLEALLGPVSREAAVAPARSASFLSARSNPTRSSPAGIRSRALSELAASIEASGLLQPVIVRTTGSGYELVAGERRWRAVQQLGWARVPAVVRDVDDRALLTLALIENLQRDDLSPMDEARGYDRLQSEFQVSQVEVARLVGRNRATVANSLRLLTLPEDVQQLLDRKALSEGHGRALLAIGDDAEISRVAAHGPRARMVGARDGSARSLARGLPWCR